LSLARLRDRGAAFFFVGAGFGLAAAVFGEGAGAGMPVGSPKVCSARTVLVVPLLIVRSKFQKTC
jgi:hypothetical protein